MKEIIRLEKMVQQSRVDATPIFPFKTLSVEFVYEISSFEMEIYHARMNLLTKWTLSLEEVITMCSSELDYPNFKASIFPSPMFGTMIQTAFLVDEEIIKGAMWYIIYAMYDIPWLSSCKEVDTYKLCLLHDMVARFPATEEWGASIEATLNAARVLVHKPVINKLAQKL